MMTDLEVSELIDRKLAKLGFQYTGTTARETLAAMIREVERLPSVPPQAELKWTPGPWRVTVSWDMDEKPPVARYGIAAGRRDGPHENKGQFHPSQALHYADEVSVVAVSFDRDYNYPEGAVAKEADAILIAAAPDLYASLDALLNAWWAEFIAFFGGDAEADAEHRADFEAVPQVVAARAVLAQASGDRRATTEDPQ